MTSSNCEMAAARSTELGFKGQIHIEREERRKVKGLETKMKKEWRNVKKRGTAQSNRERKQRPKSGNVGDAHGRKIEETLPITATLLKMKMKTELFIQFAA